MARAVRSRSVLYSSTQGYKAQADLVLAHLDGLLDGCQVLTYSLPAQTQCMGTLLLQVLIGSYLRAIL